MTSTLAEDYGELKRHEWEFQRHTAFAEEPGRLLDEHLAHAAAAMLGRHVHLRDLSLQARAGVEEDQPAEADDVADAIYDHYRPVGLDDPIPRNLIGCAVAMADKLDSIVGCFAVGEQFSLDHAQRERIAAFAQQFQKNGWASLSGVNPVSYGFLCRHYQVCLLPPPAQVPGITSR